MEVKKNLNADLEKKSSLFLNIGLCVSLLLVITAFEWKFYDRGAGMDLGSIDDNFEDLMEIPQTEQPPPPPPRRGRCHQALWRFTIERVEGVWRSWTIW